jgi:hypothetical protein
VVTGINFDMASYSFSLSEIWYIASQNAPCIIVGIEDPILGLTTQEIEKVGQDAYVSLKSKNLIIHKNGSDRFIDDLLIISYAIAHPENSVILTIDTVPNAKQIRYFHYSNDLIVELNAINLSTYRVDIHTDKQVISQVINQSIENYPPLYQGSKTITIFSKDFDEFLTCIKSRDIEKALAFTNKPGEVDLRFFQALSSPLTNISVAVHHSRNNPSCQFVSGFGLLIGEGSMWELKPSHSGTKECIEIVSTNTSQLEIRLREVLP